jgi:hypothetical protein
MSLWLCYVGSDDSDDGVYDGCVCVVEMVYKLA